MSDKNVVTITTSPEVQRYGARVWSTSVSKILISTYDNRPYKMHTDYVNGKSEEEFYFCPSCGLEFRDCKVDFPRGHVFRLFCPLCQKQV